jgi:beta-phosphoglucomutase
MLIQSDLALFDFDGVLVNTEHLHWEAYREMCRRHKFDLDWDFARYCESAHRDSHLLRKDIYEKFPLLHKQVPDWKILYAEKTQIYLDLIASGKVSLMPGVENILTSMKRAGTISCVVTNSTAAMVKGIQKQLPQLLDLIAHWLTREDYSAPKPSPEGYLKAKALFGKEGDHIIGFEDTPKGLNALIDANVKPYFVTSADYPLRAEVTDPKVQTILGFDSLLSSE